MQAIVLNDLFLSLTKPHGLAKSLAKFIAHENVNWQPREVVASLSVFIFLSFQKLKSDLAALSFEHSQIDPELYKARSVIEHSFAWLDGFKNVLLRFETKAQHWFTWLQIASFVIFARKIHAKTKL